jgi:hypothetical protein
VSEQTERRQGREAELQPLGPPWRWSPMVEALPALRGVPFTAAVTLLAEVGDLLRFATPRQLMSYLGLVPSEHSRGERRRQGSITKTGNAHARRVLLEGAGASRSPATVSRPLQRRLEHVPQGIQDLRWTAQGRRCPRSRRLVANGAKLRMGLVLRLRRSRGYAQHERSFPARPERSETKSKDTKSTNFLPVRLVARGKQVNHVVVALARARAALVWDLPHVVPLAP